MTGIGNAWTRDALHVLQGVAKVVDSGLSQQLPALSSLLRAVILPDPPSAPSTSHERRGDSATEKPQEDTVQPSQTTSNTVDDREVMQDAVDRSQLSSTEAKVEVDRKASRSFAVPVAEQQQQQQQQLRERSVPSSRISRFVGFGGLAVRLAAGSIGEMAQNAFRGSESESRQSILSSSNAERLAETLCRMRGAALKIGQMLSIQDENLLPPEIQQALARVRDAADVMPQRQLNQVMTEDLGPSWRDLYAEFSAAPVAAASIGQVHRGKLAEDEREVAIKVQYPGVAQSIESDLENLKRVLKIANVLPRGLYIDRIMEVGRRELLHECNYDNEAESQALYAKLVADDDRFRVPSVVKAASAPRVLTTDWIHGLSIDRAAAHLPQEERNRVASNLLELTVRELFEWRYMQTDPNFGNFLYCPDGTLGLIDFGACRHYPDEFVEEYLRMVVACADRNREGVLDASRNLGFLTGDESRSMLDAHAEAGFIVGEPFAASGGYDFASSSMTSRLSAFGSVMLEHRLTPPPDEAYSLHRKLSGAFLMCMRLRASVDCKSILREHSEKMQWS